MHYGPRRLLMIVIILIGDKNVAAEPGRVYFFLKYYVVNNECVHNGTSDQCDLRKFVRHIQNGRC